LTYTFANTLVALTGFNQNVYGLIFVGIGGLFLAIFIILLIDRKEAEILSMGSELNDFESLFEVELFLVVMLHELELLS
jgi:hypothetical protein